MIARGRGRSSQFSEIKISEFSEKIFSVIIHLIMKIFLKKIVVYLITLEAKYILQKFQPLIIAITGNLGKTSTKEAIYAVLKNNLVDAEGESLVQASKKSFNSEFGVPLSILNLSSGYSNFFSWIKIIFLGLNKCFTEKYFQYLILEIGADMPGDIQNIVEYIKPDIVVLTAFAEVPVHVENFQNDREKLIREKKYLLEALKSGGLLMYNSDDRDSEKMVAEISAKKNIILKSYSLKNHQSDILATNIQILRSDNIPTGMLAKIRLAKLQNKEFEKEKEQEKEKTKEKGEANLFETGKENTFDLKIQGSLGESVILSTLPAILIGQYFNLDLQKIILALENLKLPNGRMKILDGMNNTIIIDDSYNASPKAVEHGIQTIQNINLKEIAKKIFVLGDMLELGEYTRAEHLRIGQLAGQNCQILITAGIRARLFAEGALDAGLSEKNIFQTDNSILAGKELLQILEELKEERFQAGLSEEEIKKIRDLIYIKGSQGARMEKITKMILAENHDSNLDLVRQDDFWKGK